MRKIVIVFCIVLFFPLQSYSQGMSEVGIRALETCAASYAEQGNYSAAIRLCTEALENREIMKGKEHQDYANSLSNLANYNAYMGNYDEAIRLNTEALGIYERVLGKENSCYTVTLSNLANFYSDMGNNADALRLSYELLEIYEKSIGKKQSVYASSLHDMASYNYNMGNYEEAVRLETEALDIYNETIGKENYYYVLSLNNLAISSHAVGKYAEALRRGSELEEILANTIGKDNSDYATSIDNLAGFNSDMGNYVEAIRLGTEVLEIRASVLGKEHSDYALSLNNLARYYSAIGNYVEAIRLGTEALEIRAIVLGKDHQDYALSLNNLAGYHFAIGNYAEGIRLGTEALEIYEKTIGKDNSGYARSLSNLAMYNSVMGNYAEAIRLGTEALEIRASVLHKGHPDYATSLNNLASYYSNIGNYEEAMRLGTEALKIYENTKGKENADYARSLNNLAMYNSEMGNYAEAIRLDTEALEIRASVLGKEHQEYATSINNLACCHFALGNYQEALRLSARVSEIYEGAIGIGKEHHIYATSLYNLANCNLYSGNFEEAVRLGREALKIYEGTLGKKHQDYAICLCGLAKFYFYDGKYNEACHFATNTTIALSSVISKAFSDLTASERRMFWNMYYKWFEEDMPNYAYYIGSDSLQAIAYDGALMSKGLLLNSEIEMSKLLLESGDTAVVRKYNELQRNRMMLNRLYETPIAERYMDTDSLESIAQKQEQELVRLSTTYGDYTRNLTIDWRQVRDNLSNEDVAIEFLKFNAMNDSVMYVALTLTMNDSCPRMTPLFEKNELDGIKNLYSKETSELVWKPIAEVIEGKQNIYFSPAGELHNIAIESLPCFDEDGYMSDKWHIYRLSSTRELAVEKDRYAMSDAYIYGDLRYNMGVDGLVANSEKYEDTKRGVDWETVDIADSMGFRGSRLDPLPATRHEIENVDRALKEQHVNTTLLTDTVGTETSFKALSGKKTNVLHIATHGFYWTENKVESTNARRIKTLMGNDTGSKYVEDKAMTRSGLFFAGAQNALDGEEIPENVDDGILTANEISMLDLRGLDLVVLSACDTGMGDITGDGVFGLQRGFKKAGAQTIVMSLAEVADKPTEIFMTRFYTNLKAGMPKYEAFQKAQRYLRDYKGDGQTDADDPLYAEPQFWAPFIILDATD